MKLCYNCRSMGINFVCDNILTIVIISVQIYTVTSFSASVCRGDSIKMATINANNRNVSLFVSDFKHRSRLIVTWPQKTVAPIVIQSSYAGKLVRDEYGNIWIHNVTSSDEAVYLIKYEGDENINNYTLNLTVMVAPDTTCKPKIKHMDTILSASLDSAACGKPPAYVVWFYPSDLDLESKTVAKLPEGRKAGTYTACLAGPSLSCTRSLTLSDYCTSFTIKEYSTDSEPNNGVIQSELSPILILQVLCFGFIILALIVNAAVCYVYKRNVSVWRKRNIFKGHMKPHEGDDGAMIQSKT